MKKEKEFIKKITGMGDRLFIEIPNDKKKHYKKGDWVIVEPLVLRGRGE